MLWILTYLLTRGGELTREYGTAKQKDLLPSTGMTTHFRERRLLLLLRYCGYSLRLGRYYDQDIEVASLQHYERTGWPVTYPRALRVTHTCHTEPAVTAGGRKPKEKKIIEVGQTTQSRMSPRPLQPAGTSNQAPKGKAVQGDMRPQRAEVQKTEKNRPGQAQTGVSSLPRTSQSQRKTRTKFQVPSRATLPEWARGP